MKIIKYNSGPIDPVQPVKDLRFEYCPRLIHAWHSAGVLYADAGQPQLAGRPVRFFDPFA